MGGTPPPFPTELGGRSDGAFLIGHEFVFKVKGGGLQRYTDTTFESYGIADLDAVKVP
jgi:hypothetical protein